MIPSILFYSTSMASEVTIIRVALGCVHIVIYGLGCVHIEIYGIRYALFAIRYSVFAVRYTDTAVHIEVAPAFSVLFS